MKNFIIMLALLMGFGGAVSAHQHALVNIKNAEKVVVKAGISHHKLMGMAKCLLMLKKYDSAEKAIEEKMAKIKELCTSFDMDAEKCEKKQKHAMHKIHNCFMKKEFFEVFMKSSPKVD